MENIEERVRKIVREKLSENGITAETINSDAHLVLDLGFDSLDMIEAVMDVEDEFGIEISDEDGEKLVTVQQVIDYVTANARV